MSQFRVKMLRYDEAIDRLRQAEDLRTRQLAYDAVFRVLRRFTEQRDLPVADFDLEFFVEIVLEFCSEHENIQRLLNGEDLRWWPEEPEIDAGK